MQMRQPRAPLPRERSGQARGAASEHLPQSDVDLESIRAARRIQRNGGIDADGADIGVVANAAACPSAQGAGEWEGLGAVLSRIDKCGYSPAVKNALAEFQRR